MGWTGGCRRHRNYVSGFRSRNSMGPQRYSYPCHMIGLLIPSISSPIRARGDTGPNGVNNPNPGDWDSGTAWIDVGGHLKHLATG